MYTESRMTDWDAAQYHKVSDPQRAWGLRVLDRLNPSRGERVLDIGCGTARLTSEIAKKTDRPVVGVDPSRTMLREAALHFGPLVQLVQADGVRLPFADRSFDAVFSTATFHWIADHASLFSEIHRILRPGGRLVAQCGGGPNLQRLYLRAQRLRSEEDYAPHFDGWADPWNFAGAETTRARLTDAGLVGVDVSLEPAQTPFANVETYEQFVTTVCLRHHVERLPEPLRYPFVHELAVAAAADDPPLTLDYWRLNVDGRRA